MKSQKIDILQCIDNIIFSGYKESISGNTFELKENNKNTKCKKAKIKKTANVLVYKFDKEPQRDGMKIKDKFPFFNNVPGVKSMADFLLFYVRNDRLFVIICNLKSGNISNSPDQIEAGKIFANFLVETARRKFKDDFEDVKPEFVPVLYSSASLYKGKSKSNQIPQNKIRQFISNDLQTDTCDLDVICH